MTITGARVVQAGVFLALVLSTTPLRADFRGSYALTPVSGPSYGFWTGAVGPAGGWIDCSQAPTQLVLAVPPGSLYASGLEFTAQAAASGLVRFSALSVSRDTGGYIYWFYQRHGTNPVYQPLDQSPSGQPQTFTFAVTAGDTFGFMLNCGSDAIPSGTPPRISLTLTNFWAPEIPPTIHVSGGMAQGDSTFQFSFTNYPGAPWRVLATSDLTLPPTEWTVLDGLEETQPGQFHFTDAQATNHLSRFYLLAQP